MEASQRDRVVAFVELCLMAMLRVENAHRSGHQHEVTTNMLNKTLVRCIIPWIYYNRTWTMDERQWPISVDQFKELDRYFWPTTFLMYVRATSGRW